MGKTAKKPTKQADKPPARKASARGDKRLVIVESPAKAKTINRYLGKDYIVRASMGHVRDLPARQMGVDVEHDFQPTYEPLAGRKKVLTELRKYAKDSPEVFLATDLDSEGEAIAWHLAESLGVPAEKVRRVIFNQITASAIREAFENPHEIDMNKVNAQQARRILDRLVGYEVSPLLWRKVAAGLSAGRVQSVAVRLIVTREREIEAFEPEEYWRIGAVFTPRLEAAAELAEQWQAFLAARDAKGNPPTRQAQQEFLEANQAFRAELLTFRGERFKADNAEAALQVAQGLGFEVRELKTFQDPDAKGAARNRVTVVGALGGAGPALQVADVRARDSQTRPPAPFTTATLQHAAAVSLRFTASQTMRLAQQLYEGVEIPGEGRVGLITYMRTDSRHLAGEAVAAARRFIGERFGAEYLPEKPHVYSSGQRAQEAHEAIRPTDVRRTPQTLIGVLETR